MVIRPTVTLRRSDNPGFSPAVFVNGLAPRTTRIWIIPQGEGIEVRFKGDHDGITADSVLQAITSIVSDATLTWSDLWKAAATIADCDDQSSPMPPPTDASPAHVPNQVLLAIDLNEPKDIVDALRSDERFTILQEALAPGRYVIEGHLELRRATSADAAADTLPTIWSGPRPILVLETHGTRLEPPDWSKAMDNCCRLALRKGVGIIQSRSRAGTISTIKRCVTEAAELPPLIGLREPNVGGLPLPIAMLSLVPGISRQMAAALTAKFGSIERIAQAPQENLAVIEGVGTKRAAAIALALKSGLSLT